MAVAPAASSAAPSSQFPPVAQRPSSVPFVHVPAVCSRVTTGSGAGNATASRSSAASAVSTTENTADVAVDGETSDARVASSSSAALSASGTERTGYVPSVFRAAVLPSGSYIVTWSDGVPASAKEFVTMNGNPAAERTASAGLVSATPNTARPTTACALVACTPPAATVSVVVSGSAPVAQNERSPCLRSVGPR